MPGPAWQQNGFRKGDETPPQAQFLGQNVPTKTDLTQKPQTSFYTSNRNWVIESFRVNSLFLPSGQYHIVELTFISCVCLYPVYVHYIGKHMVCIAQKSRPKGTPTWLTPSLPTPHLGNLFFSLAVWIGPCSRNKVGMGWTPPPVLEKFPHFFKKESVSNNDGKKKTHKR